MSEKYFTSEQEEILKQVRIEEDQMTKSLLYNSSRLDIVYGIIFLLIFKIAGGKEVVTVWTYLGIGCNILAIIIFIYLLLTMVYSTTVSLSTWSFGVRNLMIEKKNFEVIKENIKHQVENSHDQKRSIKGFIVLESIQGLLFITGLILVLL